MLTQEQIQKLEPLTHHPRFGPILKDAMVNWMLPNVNPESGQWGVKWSNDRYIHEEGLGCCLIGSYCIGKENLDKKDPSPFSCEIASQYSKIDFDEITVIVDGFDQSKNSEFYPKAYEFGKQVSIILFGDLNAN